MSFNITFASFHACPLYYVSKIEIHLFKIIGIQPCIHSHKMWHITKKKCCMKKYGHCPMHNGTKMCKFFLKPNQNGEHLWTFGFNKRGGRNSLSKPSSYYITNLLCFITSYTFHAKSGFHRFVQKSHEFFVKVNMNDICTYSVLKIFKHMRHF